MKWKRWILEFAGPLAFSAAVVLAGWRCWTYLRPEDKPNDPVKSALSDFQDVVYYPARAAMAGVNPYDARPAADGGVYYARFPAGNSFPLYAPLIFIPSIPFAVLPLVTAEIAWWFVNLGLLLLYAVVALRLANLPVRLGTVTGLAALFLLSRPGHANFYFGALALPLSLATIGAWYFAERHAWLSAGCLALACIKPTFGGPLVILMLLGGKHRALALGLGLTLVANVAALALFLPNEFRHSRPLEMLAHNQAVIDDDPAVDPLKSSSRVDFPFTVERIWGRHFPGYIRFSITLMMLAVAGWHLRRLRLVDNPVNRRLQAAIAVNGRPGTVAERWSAAIACLTIGICIYHNIYDGLLAAVPAAAAYGALANNGKQESRWLLYPLAILFVIPAIHFFTSRQFLNWLSDAAPGLSQIVSHPGLWTLLCVLNGVSLTVAWCLLLVASRASAGEKPSAAKPV